MTDKQIILNIISEEMDIPMEDIKPNMSIRSLGADSLEIVFMLQEVSAQCNVEVPSDQWFRLHTIDDILQYVGTNK